jgi:predicted amidohydrolase
VEPLRIALAQLAPRLGDLEANLARHAEVIATARGEGAGLIVFPELGLTGYLLQDLAAEVAMPLDDPRLAALAAALPSSPSSRSPTTTASSSRPP